MAILVPVNRNWGILTSPLYQGAPGSKFSKAPYSRSAKGTSQAPYMHEFSRGIHIDSLKCHFLDFGERFYRILMVRKRHCNISKALANVFAQSLGAPIWPIGVGGPRVCPSEPIVVSSYATAVVRESWQLYRPTYFGSSHVQIEPTKVESCPCGPNINTYCNSQFKINRS